MLCLIFVTFRVYCSVLLAMEYRELWRTGTRKTLQYDFSFENHIWVRFILRASRSAAFSRLVPSCTEPSSRYVKFMSLSGRFSGWLDSKFIHTYVCLLCLMLTVWLSPPVLHVWRWAGTQHRGVLNDLKESRNISLCQSKINGFGRRFFTILAACGYSFQLVRPEGTHNLQNLRDTRIEY